MAPRQSRVGTISGLWLGMLAGAMASTPGKLAIGRVTGPPRECRDNGCLARELACDLSKRMQEDWPSSMADLVQTLRLNCDGWDLTFEVSAPFFDHEATTTSLPNSSRTNQTLRESSSGDAGVDECGAPQMCTVDVIEYEKKNQAAKYGMKSGKFAARGVADHIKEILKEKKAVGLTGLVAFGYFSGALLWCILPKCRWASCDSLLHFCNKELG